MIIGVLKEIKEGEKRVALTPAGTRFLVDGNHKVFIEKDAGSGSGLADEEYTREGGQVVSKEEVYRHADMIVKVKEPLEDEWDYFSENQILFTYLHLASSKSYTTGLMKTGIIGVAYETVEDRKGRLPLLIPMSEVAGRMSVQLAMRYLETDSGGRGVLMSGVPGVPPAEVVILGAGVVGYNAAQIACGLGAQVTVFDIDHERLRFVDASLHGCVITVYSTPLMVQKAVSFADVVIGAVLVPGARAPIVVSEEMVKQMKAGSVIVDVSVDQGGSVETIRPTSHAAPTYTLYDVLHSAIPNIPGAVPRTSTYALTNATLPYIRTIADRGLARAAAENPGIARGINFAQGKIAHPAVASSLDLPLTPWEKLFKKGLTRKNPMR